MNAVERLVEKWERPVSLVFILAGFIFILLGLSSGINALGLSVVVDPGSRILSIAIGVGCWVAAFLLDRTPNKRRDIAPQMATIPTENKSDLKIVSATYGVGEQKKDVTDLLNSRIGLMLVVKVTNEALGGDPAEGKEKVLEVTYSYGGQTLKRKFPERTLLVLPED